MNDTIGKLKEPGPEEPTPVEKLLDILTEVDAESRKEGLPGAECLPRYWQGKKDGIRLAMIVLLGGLDDESLRGDLNNIRQLQMTSRQSRYTLGEESEIFKP